MNEQQLAAVEARGEVFVSAGAGTGKTTVLVERFVRAVCDQGLDVESVLVITYTRKAAGELRARIRAALHARGRPDLARRRHRPALPRAGRRARKGHPRRGVRDGADGVLHRSRRGAAEAAGDVRGR